INQTYHSSFSGKARGVAILLHKTVPFVHTSVVSDPNGRFVIVTGQIHNISVALINIYAPNYDDEGFFKRLFSLIPDLSTHYLILGGDFNCWLNPHLDRSSSAVCAPSRSAKVILSFMKNMLFLMPGASFFSQLTIMDMERRPASYWHTRYVEQQHPVKY
uniref:Endonuclease/exonuclease/phosphatase domain-containing protein n=1 Tax=Denticeps clupeoides TaxID=299321 RepID=A0AAY4A9I4_9TELE